MAMKKRSEGETVKPLTGSRIQHGVVTSMSLHVLGDSRANV